MKSIFELPNHRKKLMEVSRKVIQAETAKCIEELKNKLKDIDKHIEDQRNTIDSIEKNRHPSFISVSSLKSILEDYKKTKSDLEDELKKLTNTNHSATNPRKINGFN